MFQIIWKFEPKDGERTRFKRAYAPNGPWSRLFRRADGFVGTQLLADNGGEEAFITIDTWHSEDHYRSFQSDWKGEYERLDRELGHLTTTETLVGTFECAPRKPLRRR